MILILTNEYSISYLIFFPLLITEMPPDYDTDDESSCIYEELPGR